MRDLNLARQPFVNLRPIRRAGAALIALGLALLAVNALLYWRHFTGEGKTRSRSQELAREVVSKETEIARLREEISGLEIDGLNRRARFINAEIDRRRFGWSRLFDHVAEVQPESVRLLSLIPRFPEQPRRGRSRSLDEGVTLDIRGVAKNDGEILEFIDGLFGHPAFSRPDISRESRLPDGSVDFALTATYLANSQDDRSAVVEAGLEPHRSDGEAEGVTPGASEDAG